MAKIHNKNVKEGKFIDINTKDSKTRKSETLDSIHAIYDRFKDAYRAFGVKAYCKVEDFDLNRLYECENLFYDSSVNFAENVYRTAGTDPDSARFVDI